MTIKCIVGTKIILNGLRLNETTNLHFDHARDVIRLIHMVATGSNGDVANWVSSY